MSGWIVLGVYAAGYVLAARKLAFAFINADGDPSSPGDLGLTRALGCLTALGWPLIILGALITGKLPKTDKQVRDERDAMQERIRELEAELGMRPSL